MNSFNNTWKQAEKEFAHYFKGNIVRKKELQYKDIDVKLKNRKSYVSVKDQYESSECYGAVLFETVLTNSRTGAKAKGSLLKCEAGMYAVRLFYNGEVCWYITLTKDLLAYLKANAKSFKRITTRPETEARNRAQGRKYDGSVCISVPVNELVENTKCLCIPLKDLKGRQPKHIKQLLLQNKFTTK